MGSKVQVAKNFITLKGCKIARLDIKVSCRWRTLKTWWLLTKCSVRTNMAPRSFWEVLVPFSKPHILRHMMYTLGCHWMASSSQHPSSNHQARMNKRKITSHLKYRRRGGEERLILSLCHNGVTNSRMFLACLAVTFKRATVHLTQTSFTPSLVTASYWQDLDC